MLPMWSLIFILVSFIAWNILYEKERDSSKTQKTIIATLQQEIRHLKKQLAVATNKNASERGLSNTKIKDIKLENERLHKELQSFSLDFFEEIEDLKFKYHEASKRLACYETGSGDVRFNTSVLLWTDVFDLFLTLN